VDGISDAAFLNPSPSNFIKIQGWMVMPDKLRLEIMPAVAHEPATCALCESVFEFGNAAALLYDKDALRGCQKCLADKPFRIASKVTALSDKAYVLQINGRRNFGAPCLARENS
jgi:hypothetical protein